MEIKNIFLLVLGLFIFSNAFNNLKADNHIIYINSSIPSGENIYKLSNGIYNKLKTKYGTENISNPMQISNKQIQNNFPYKEIQETEDNSIIERRPRGYTVFNSFPAESYHWNLLYKEIDSVINQKKHFYLIIFGNPNDIVKKASEQFKSNNLLNEYLIKIIYLIPYENMEQDLNEDPKDLDSSVNKLENQDDSKDSLLKSQSTFQISLPEKIKAISGQQNITVINLEQIKKNVRKDLNFFQVGFFKIIGKYKKKIFKNIFEHLIEIIDAQENLDGEEYENL